MRKTLLSVETDKVDPYPISDRLKDCLRDARVRVAHMDKVDGSKIDELPVDMALQTILSALECTVVGGDLTCAADAYVMIYQLEHSIRMDAK